MSALLRILLAVALGLIVAAVSAAAGLQLIAEPPRPLPAPPAGADLDGVTLVEPGGRRLPGVRVRIDGARIAEIAPAAAGARGPFAGAFVLPALTDMHIHFPATGFPGDEAYTALLLVRHGVANVRVTGGTDPEDARSLRARVEAGRLPGPRIFSCGPIIDGPEPVIPGSRTASTPAEARSIVAELAAAGADCIKAYDRLDLDTTAALRAAAHEAGLPIIGHTPQALALEDARLDDLQHLRGAHPPFEGEDLRYPYFLGAWQRMDRARVAHVIEVSRRTGMAHTPTLVAIEGTVVAWDWALWRQSETMQLWLPHLRDGLWSGEVGFNPIRFITRADVDMVQAAREQMARTVRELHEAGVPIHTGTDSNAPNVVPGASLHRELELLVEAGLTPEQALAASTRTSPRFLGVEGAGELRVGAPADLVVYQRDPTTRVDALATIAAVVVDGRLYTRKELERRLARYRAHYQGWPFQTLVMPPLRAGLSALTAWLRSRR